MIFVSKKFWGESWRGVRGEMRGTERGPKAVFNPFWSLDSIENLLDFLGYISQSPLFFFSLFWSLSLFLLLSFRLRANAPLIHKRTLPFKDHSPTKDPFQSAVVHQSANVQAFFYFTRPVNKRLSSHSMSASNHSFACQTKHRFITSYSTGRYPSFGFSWRLFSGVTKPVYLTSTISAFNSCAQDSKAYCSWNKTISKTQTPWTVPTSCI